jgi:predicted DNA-binding antitoxin AbrB/MazE fold protein
VLAKPNFVHFKGGEKMTIVWKYKLEKISKVARMFAKDFQEKISKDQVKQFIQ